jgi:flagella basal body P-ring formation protein FlgA
MIPTLLLLVSLTGSVTQADMERLLGAQLPRAAGEDSLRWTLTTGWPELALPKGATGLELAAPPGEPRTGVMPCMLRITGGGEVLRAVPFAVRCERVGRGLKLLRAVPAGALLTSDDFELATGAMPQGERPIASDEDALAHRARRSLPRGAWLTAGSLERTPLVRNGAPLTVIAGTASMVVRFQAVAQGQGALGQVIRARGPRPGALLNVKLTGPGMAELVP